LAYTQDKEQPSKSAKNAPDAPSSRHILKAAIPAKLAQNETGGWCEPAASQPNPVRRASDHAARRIYERIYYEVLRTHQGRECGGKTQNPVFIGLCILHETNFSSHHTNRILPPDLTSRREWLVSQVEPV
jgi:hypothetical protein